MLMIGSMFAVIFAIWLLVAMKDSFTSCCFRRRGHEAWWNNFLIRFLYEVFFEVSICLMLSFTILDLNNLKNSWEWGLTVGLAVLALICLCLLSFLCFKSGPYVKGTYESRSLAKSFWHFRSIRADHHLFKTVSSEKT